MTRDIASLPQTNHVPGIEAVFFDDVAEETCRSMSQFATTANWNSLAVVEILVDTVRQLVNSSYQEPRDER